MFTESAKPVGRTVEALPGEAVPGEPRRKKRVLLIGGCQMSSLSRELHDDFDASVIWRRPTITLMSPPIALIGELGFENRQSRFIREDCAKTHLPDLQAAECDILVFDVLRDAHCWYVRAGDTYLFDPNRMDNLIPDAVSAKVRPIDVAALFGVSKVETFGPFDPSFFKIWCAQFDKFYEAVLAPRIAGGCTVVLQQVYLSKQTRPPSDAIQPHWAFCDNMNALMRRMFARVAKYPGIKRIGVDESECITSDDAPYGGPNFAHPVRDVFLKLADQLRTIDEQKEPAPGQFVQLMRRAGERGRAALAPVLGWAR